MITKTGCWPNRFSSMTQNRGITRGDYSLLYCAGDRSETFYDSVAL